MRRCPCLCNIQSHIKELKKLITRESPSIEHVRALECFDHVRIKFSRAFMAFMLFHSLAWIAAGSYFTEQFKEFA